MSVCERAKSIKVCLVEDDPGIRKALGLLLQRSGGLELLGAFANASEALSEIPRRRPDVVLMDIGLAGDSGIECVRQLKQAHEKIEFMMLTVYEDSDRIIESFEAGASGYMLKRSTREELVNAIVEVASGGGPMPSHIARRVIGYFQSKEKKEGLKCLTPRELEVLEVLADGDAYKQIAARLSISMDTVRKHLQSIYRKLRVSSRHEAVMEYLRNTSRR